MTDLPPPPDPSAVQAWRTSRATLVTQAVEILTQAVRLDRPRSAGGVEPGDFAEFVASVLAAVAANVGSVERLTTGRPGSWEADLIHQLAYGTVGDDPDTLVTHRTEPVRVPLNVAQLVEDHGPRAQPPVTSLWDAIDTASPLPTGSHGDDLSDEEWEALEAAHDQIEADLHHRYQTAYADYARRFRAAVEEAARAIPALTTADPASSTTVLRVPVEVTAETDPDTANTSIDNPTEWDWADDPLAWRLWSSAYHRLGLPRP